MKDIDAAAAITIDMAKCLIANMQAAGVEWLRAFARIEFRPGVQECKGCYLSRDGVTILDVFKHRPMFRALESLGERLREATTNEEKQFCVALLEVNSRFDYEIHYEWQDSSRWRISKLNGGTGMPEGLQAP